MNRKSVISLLVFFGFLATLLIIGENRTINAAKESKQNKPTHSQTAFNLFSGYRLFDREEPFKTYDDELAEVAKQMPGFGGMFYDAEGVLQVYMLDRQAAIVTDMKSALESVITREIFSGENMTEKGLEVIEGKYDFLQLKGWHDQMSAPVLENPDVVFTDIDDATNRLVVGVSNLKATKQIVEEYLDKIGIPLEAVVIKKTKPINQDLRANRRPLVGGLQIASSPGNCTLGFIGRLNNGVIGFVTASHCTNTRGGVESTAFHQPSISGTTNRVGIETIDPTFFTGGQCPRNRSCRFSDSAFVSVPFTGDSNVATSRGLIAQPPLNSTAWDGTTTYSIRSKLIRGSSPVGTNVIKVGRTTGRTTGTVTEACVNANVNNTSLTLLCQSRANYTRDSGDSGAAVFKADDNFNTLQGVHWGSNGTFSPYSSVESELGTMQVFP